MANLKNSVQRLALAGGFAIAVAAAPALTAFVVPATASVAACPEGQTLNQETGGCEAMPGAAPQDGASYSTPGDSNSVPEVQGVPCTGANTGECIGLQEDQQAPAVEPRSTISSSP
ncbi:intersectin-EH binding protein Ibp1 [Mycobacterium sp. CVI_P3]|uniref:Intersectin-EH binding protein Ibp1 n=1 Tax=Mycobacterium pinniadriaticum TaxID=2994102 RepID=A0ABT3S8G2_9MYCO|nr:intersectin-EH binding protein Ibp1 [Mycobacterium pinniadriaticum]MCX2928903.1 intersectin-EH binding protein Ibp1 [Mycobacterium pinniadriaticum]MCX2935230.1 intersectin-EH binding protein Ibp1 [Mycobacterium pinniadriaticum]